MAEMLVAQRANVCLRHGSNRSVLQIAAGLGRHEIVGNLLRHGADVFHEYNDGNAALIMGAMNGFPKVVDLLIQWGADVNYVNERGENALTVCCVGLDNYIKISCSLVLAKGADLALKGAKYDAVLSRAKDVNNFTVIYMIQLQIAFNLAANERRPQHDDDVLRILDGDGRRHSYLYDICRGNLPAHVEIFKRNIESRSSNPNHDVLTKEVLKRCNIGDQPIAGYPCLLHYFLALNNGENYLGETLRCAMIVLNTSAIFEDSCFPEDIILKIFAQVPFHRVTLFARSARADLGDSSPVLGEDTSGSERAKGMG